MFLIIRLPDWLDQMFWIRVKKIQVDRCRNGDHCSRGTTVGKKQRSAFTGFPVAMADSNHCLHLSLPGSLLSSTLF